MCVHTKYWSCEHVPPGGTSCAKEAKLGQESPGGRENSPSHREPIVSSPDNYIMVLANCAECLLCVLLTRITVLINCVECLLCVPHKSTS